MVRVVIALAVALVVLGTGSQGGAAHLVHSEGRPRDFAYRLILPYVCVETGVSPRVAVSTMDGMVLIRVPAGTFMMGSSETDPEEAWPSEKPQHEVYLDDTGSIGPRSPTPCSSASNGPPGTNRRDGATWERGSRHHPVSWLRGSTPARIAFGREGSCRPKPSGRRRHAGQTGASTRGETRPPRRSCATAPSLLQSRSTPVGRYSPKGDSPYGCADMAGNAQEWVADWCDEGYYANSPRENPTGPTSGFQKVVRGGYWGMGKFVRSSLRSCFASPGRRDTGIGFRCASIPESK